MAAFEAKFKGKDLDAIVEGVKVALMNPAAAFKLGTPALLKAVEGTVSSGPSERSTNQPKEVGELKNELARLKADTHKKVVAMRT